MRESDGKEVDTLLKNNIEGIILKWAYQVNTEINVETSDLYYCTLPDR